MFFLQLAMWIRRRFDLLSGAGGGDTVAPSTTSSQACGLALSWDHSPLCFAFATLAKGGDPIDAGMIQPLIWLLVISRRSTLRNYSGKYLPLHARSEDFRALDILYNQNRELMVAYQENEPLFIRDHHFQREETCLFRQLGCQANWNYHWLSLLSFGICHITNQNELITIQIT